MNRSSSGFLLPKVIEGFLNHSPAEGASHGTIVCYRHDLAKLLEHVGDRPIEQVTVDVLCGFMAWLRTAHQSRRFNGQTYTGADDFPQRISSAG